MINEYKLADALNAEHDLFELSFGTYLDMRKLRDILNNLPESRFLWTYHPNKRRKFRLEEKP